MSSSNIDDLLVLGDLRRTTFHVGAIDGLDIERLVSVVHADSQRQEGEGTAAIPPP